MPLVSDAAHGVATVPWRRRRRRRRRRREEATLAEMESGPGPGPREGFGRRGRWLGRLLLICRHLGCIWARLQPQSGGDALGTAGASAADAPTAATPTVALGAAPEGAAARGGRGGGDGGWHVTSGGAPPHLGLAAGPGCGTPRNRLPRPGITVASRLALSSLAARPRCVASRSLESQPQEARLAGFGTTRTAALLCYVVLDRTGITARQTWSSSAKLPCRSCHHCDLTAASCARDCNHINPRCIPMCQKLQPILCIHLPLDRHLTAGRVGLLAQVTWWQKKEGIMG